MPRRARTQAPKMLDIELDELPPALRWRTWMGRAEAVIFAADKPATREMIAGVVGKACNIEDLIADIGAELAERPYELVKVAGGWQHRTRKAFGDAINAATGLAERAPRLSPLEAQVLTAIAYLQPITRADIGAIFAREIGRDILADLRAFKLIAAGPRSPRPGAPLTYVTTPQFLSCFGLDSLNDLPDRQQLEDEGLASNSALIADQEWAPASRFDDEDQACDIDADSEAPWPGTDPFETDQ